MDTIDIITLVAVILFVRLGIRLFLYYQKKEKEQKQNKDNLQRHNLLFMETLHLLDSMLQKELKK